MSRWPRGIDAAYLEHESNERYRRVEAVMERRRREFMLSKPLPEPIVDRDPGDEDRSTP